MRVVGRHHFAVDGYKHRTFGILQKRTDDCQYRKRCGINRRLRLLRMREAQNSQLRGCRQQTQINRQLRFRRRKQPGNDCSSRRRNYAWQQRVYAVYFSQTSRTGQQSDEYGQRGVRILYFA